MCQHSDCEPVPCDEIVFRAILKKSHLLNGKATADAFILRPRDNGLLSTYRRSVVTAEACRGAFNPCHGLSTLHTGHVRTIGRDNDLPIDVIADSLPEDPVPGHASIMSLPDPLTDQIHAEWIAGKLRDHCRMANPAR